MATNELADLKRFRPMKIVAFVEKQLIAEAEARNVPFDVLCEAILNAYANFKVDSPGRMVLDPFIDGWCKDVDANP